ncbi:MAG: Rieske 2Fe-2S domain-containing protein [Myxococcota bacterium]
MLRSAPLRWRARPRGARRDLPLAFVPVARVDQLDDSRGLRLKVGEIAIALYRVGDAIHAMEDACPHAGYPLSKGRYENGVIQCGAHGLRYDVRTGFDPDLRDGFPIPCFRVRVSGDTIEVDLEDRINAPPRRGPRP